MNAEPILTERCSEPSGVIDRNVYPMIFTPDNMQKFWERASEHRVLFSDEIAGSFKSFLEVFMSQEADGRIIGRGIVWIVDDFVGAYYMDHITSHEARVHFTFFDGRLRGREHLTKAMLNYVFDRYKFRRLNVEIPCYANAQVNKFVESLGFKHEGRKRKCIAYKGDVFDSKLYGLLSEELL